MMRHSPTFNIYLGARLTDEDAILAAARRCDPARAGRTARHFFHAMLRPLGLEKGKPFTPDARQTKILTEAAVVGETMAKANSADRRFSGGKYRADAHWDFALQLDADNPTDFWNQLDERASWFYEAVGAGPASHDLRRRHGFEQNWIPTVPGKNWFAYFRFYRPTEPHFDRSWQLPDFEQL
jgi:hypothetical protein